MKFRKFLKLKYFIRLIVLGLLAYPILALFTVYILPHKENKAPERFQAKDFTVSTAENFTLHANYILANAPSNKTIIFMHGIRGNSNHFLPLVDTLTAKGYNCLLLNLRAHGNSGGHYTTFGAKEKEDVSLVVDQLQAQNADVEVGVWGTSLGGAIALQAMANDERIAWGVLESTFPDLHTVINDYTKRYSGIGWQPFSNGLINLGGIYAGFNPRHVSPIKAAGKIKQPVFLVTGSQDNKMNPVYMTEIYNAVTHNQKQLLQVEGANHENVLQIGGDKYINNIINFIEHNK